MCFNEKDKDNGAILIQDVTSVIDLISPLESHEEGDHHSVTVTTRWEIKNMHCLEDIHEDVDGCTHGDDDDNTIHDLEA